MMYKLKDFFGNLSKSTKLTMISCGIFIILTFVILLFFVMFPITPSEKVISGMGRAGLVNSDGKKSNYGDSALDGVVVTTSVSDSSGKKSTVITTVGSHRSSYVDKIFTTNNGYVYTGPKTDYSSSNQTYTRTVENNNNNNNNYSYEEPDYNEPTQPYEPEPDNSASSSEPSYEPTVPDYSEPDTSNVPDESSSEPDIPDVPPVTEPPAPDNPPDDSSYVEPVPSDEPDTVSDSTEF